MLRYTPHKYLRASPLDLGRGNPDAQKLHREAQELSIHWFYSPNQKDVSHRLGFTLILLNS
jgi:hypothetical protein